MALIAMTRNLYEISVKKAFFAENAVLDKQQVNKFSDQNYFKRL